MYQFIINPGASWGRGARIWRRVEKELTRQGEEYQACLTERKGDAARRAAELTEGCREPRIIVAIGGSGTIGEIVDGLAFCGPVTMGYIPAGAGNDLARSLKLPRKPAKSLKKILDPKYHRQLDYGVVSYGGQSDHRRFVVSAGIGLDAAVCQDIAVSQAGAGRFRPVPGRWKYLTRGVRQLIAARPVKGYILLDGVKKVEFDHIYFVSAHIHPYECGGFKFAPGADPCDGRLTVRVVHQDRKRRLIPIFLGALRGSRKNYNGSRVYTCQEMEVHLDRPMPAHCDGESCGRQQELQIRCIPRRVRMIV